ncbi:hypothetical protein HKX48_003381 [Thoreauomyces humboldtii]|nr:hypothetical protein HKX48_003381 [Thoreauomyces humboldtii]
MHLTAVALVASSLFGSAISQSVTSSSFINSPTVTGVPAGIETSAPYLDGAWHLTEPAAINCGPDILVDDFKTKTEAILPLQGETAPRALNLLGGDYGESVPTGFNFTINTAQQYIQLIPQATNSFFFFKLDAGACFDLTNINALAFDIVAPPNSTFAIGLTQKSANCEYRVGGETGASDSVYKPVTNYAPSDGTKHTVVIPFQDLKGTFDFMHLKDVTFINWAPLNAVFQMSNIRLRRACNGNGATGTNATISASVNNGTTAGASSVVSGSSTAAASAAAGTDGAAAQAGTATRPNGASSLALPVGTISVAAVLAGLVAFL